MASNPLDLRQISFKVLLWLRPISPPAQKTTIYPSINSALAILAIESKRNGLAGSANPV